MTDTPAAPHVRRRFDPRPQLHAAKLEFRARAGARWSRSRAGHSLTRAAFPRLLGLGLAVAALVGLIYEWPVLIRLFAPEVVTISVLVAVPTSLWVQRSRAAWTARHAGDWLSTLPATAGAVRAAVALRAFTVPVALLATLLLLAPLLDAAAPASSHDTAQLLLGLGTALAGGALLGWWWPRRIEPVVADSMQRGFARPAPGTALAGLSSWAMLQARVWLPPRTIGRLVLPILLLLPMGTSGNLAVAIGAAWSLALWLVVLLRATVLVAQHGARWLRPTPLGIGRFSWAVAWQPTLKQIQWTLIATGLCVALGVHPARAFRVAESWLAVVTVTTDTALAEAWGGRGPGFGLVLRLGVVAAAERLRPYLGLPTAVLLALWQQRQAATVAASPAPAASS